MKKKTDREIEERAIDAVADFLRSKGWSPLVGQFSGIAQGGLKYNYELIFKFTGKKTGKKNESG